MKVLFEELSDVLAKGERVVPIIIIASSDSTPRGVGSRMLVRKDGTAKGTVGGGTMEYQAILTTVEAIKHKSSHTKGLILVRNQVADTGMVHGRNVVVYFQYISPGNKEFAGFCADVRMALSRDEDSQLLLDITDETCWRMGLYSEGIGLLGMSMPERFTDSDLFGYDTLQREAEGRYYYAEPLVQAGTVYVFDGGHVTQELVPALTHVGFRCMVMDGREEFANPQVPPTAADTIVEDLGGIGGYIKIRPCDCICVMTRGRQFDYYIRKQAMTFKPCYVGTMGSRNKIRVVIDKLLGDGLSREEIRGCHMPIRTEIRTETPTEIAISITGELISVRATEMGLKSKIDGQKQRKSRTGNLTVRQGEQPGIQR